MTSIGDHLRSISDEVLHPLNEDRVRAWAMRVTDRVAFLQTAILGSIMWDRELGRPESATLADGFIVQHLEWYIEIDSNGEATVQHQGWRPSDPPALVDGPDDETYHRVTFACSLTPLGDLVSASFRPDVPWRADSLSFGPRRVQPGDHVVPAGAVGPVLLPYLVVTVPNFVGHPARLAG